MLQENTTTSEANNDTVSVEEEDSSERDPESFTRRPKPLWVMKNPWYKFTFGERTEADMKKRLRAEMTGEINSLPSYPKYLFVPAYFPVHHINDQQALTWLQDEEILRGLSWSKFSNCLSKAADSYFEILSKYWKPKIPASTRNAVGVLFVQRFPLATKIYYKFQRSKAKAKRNSTELSIPKTSLDFETLEELLSKRLDRRRYDVKNEVTGRSRKRQKTSANAEKNSTPSSV